MAGKPRTPCDTVMLAILRGRGFTYSQIATELGVTYGVVYKRLHEMGLTVDNTGTKEDRFEDDRIRRWKLAMPWG